MEQEEKEIFKQELQKMDLTELALLDSLFYDQLKNTMIFSRTLLTFDSKKIHKLYDKGKSYLIKIDEFYQCIRDERNKRKDNK